MIRTALILSILTISLSTYAATLTGRVIWVEGGDTLTVLDYWNTQHKIRLKGIDAPEHGQPYGKASENHLSFMVAGKFIVVEYDKRDRYGRVVGKVLLSHEDINFKQVEAGLAWHCKDNAREQSPQDREAYAMAEDEAREAKRGLWKEQNPVPPWEWRWENKTK